MQNRTVHTLSLSHSMVLFLPHIRMRCERIANKNSCAKIHAHTRRRQWRHAAAARAVFGRSQPTVRTGNNVLRDCNPFAGRGTIGCTVFVVVAHWSKRTNRLSTFAESHESHGGCITGFSVTGNTAQKYYFAFTVYR